jgi:hypothetical protein
MHLPDSRHKLRSVGRIFATTHETKMLLREIALKQGWGRRRSASRLGEGIMLVRRWLDYDHVSLAVLIIGLGMVEWLALAI